MLPNNRLTSLSSPVENFFEGPQQMAKVRRWATRSVQKELQRCLPKGSKGHGDTFKGRLLLNVVF